MRCAITPRRSFLRLIRALFSEMMQRRFACLAFSIALSLLSTSLPGQATKQSRTLGTGDVIEMLFNHTSDVEVIEMIKANPGYYSGVDDALQVKFLQQHEHISPNVIAAMRAKNKEAQDRADDRFPPGTTITTSGVLAMVSDGKTEDYILRAIRTKLGDYQMIDSNGKSLEPMLKMRGVSPNIIKAMLAKGEDSYPSGRFGVQQTPPLSKPSPAIKQTVPAVKEDSNPEDMCEQPFLRPEDAQGCKMASKVWAKLMTKCGKAWLYTGSNLGRGVAENVSKANQSYEDANRSNLQRGLHHWDNIGPYMVSEYRGVAFSFYPGALSVSDEAPFRIVRSKNEECLFGQAKYPLVGWCGVTTMRSSKWRNSRGKVPAGVDVTDILWGNVDWYPYRTQTSTTPNESDPFSPLNAFTGGGFSGSVALGVNGSMAINIWRIKDEWYFSRSLLAVGGDPTNIGIALEKIDVHPPRCLEGEFQ